MQKLLRKFSPLFIAKVKEKSMEPFLKEGDEIIVKKYIFTKPKIGDIIIFRHSTPPFIFIKRVLKIKDSNYWVEGDNKNKSFDSRSFSYIKKDSVLGKMISKI